MKFHPSSFVLGVGLTAAAIAARHRLRPVVIELSALGLHLAHLARGLLEREREDAEDLWAEVEERVRDLRRRAPPEATTEPARATPVNGQAAVS